MAAKGKKTSSVKGVNPGLVGGKVPSAAPAFDVEKTLSVLRTLARKKDQGRMNSFFRALKPGKEKETPPSLSVLDRRSSSFASSLPLNVTREAQDVIQRLKDLEKGVIRFPENLNQGGEVVLIDGSVKPPAKSVIGVVRRLWVETDPAQCGIARMGMFVTVSNSDPKMLEFTIKVPSLPATLRSRRFNDLGGMGRELRISKKSEQKGDE